MAKIVEQGNEVKSTGIVTICLNSDAEISTVPTTDQNSGLILNGYGSFEVFSVAFCPKTGSMWMLDSDGWQTI